MLLVAHVTAQRDEFDVIECKLLAVNDGTILITNKDRQSFVQIGFDNHHGEAFVGVHGKDAKQKTVLRSSEHKGHATTFAKDGKRFAMLGIDDHGGFVHLKPRVRARFL